MAKQKGRNKYQKAAHREGELRVNSTEVEQLLVMSCSSDPAERAIAAQFLCPCHVRRRIDEVWQALYRMMEDPDVRVRRAAWHTLEDGGRPDDLAFAPILTRAWQHETDPQVRAFAALLIDEHRRRAQVEQVRQSRSPFQKRGKCDFCAQNNMPVRQVVDTPIAAIGGQPRLALICQQCDSKA
jgi:hypothetical protein